MASKNNKKDAVKRRKLEIQTIYKNKMEIVLDMPKQNGSGTSNDGNTARRFFRNYEFAAET